MCGGLKEFVDQPPMLGEILILIRSSNRLDTPHWMVNVCQDMGKDCTSSHSPSYQVQRQSPKYPHE